MAGRRLSSNDVSVVIALAIVVLVLLLVYVAERGEGPSARADRGRSGRRSRRGRACWSGTDPRSARRAMDVTRGNADSCGIETTQPGQSESEADAVADRQRDEAVQAILAALETRSEPRARAAALYFRAARDRVDTVATGACKERPGACSGDRQRRDGDRRSDRGTGAARRQRQRSAGLRLGLSLLRRGVARGRGHLPDGECASVGTARSGQRRSRGSPSRERRGAGETRPASTTPCSTSPQRTIHDPGWGRATAQMIAAAPQANEMAVGTWLAALTAIGYESLDLSSFQDASRYCDARALGNANRRDTCEQDRDASRRSIDDAAGAGQRHRPRQATRLARGAAGRGRAGTRRSAMRLAAPRSAAAWRATPLRRRSPRPHPFHRDRPSRRGRGAEAPRGASGESIDALAAESRRVVALDPKRLAAAQRRCIGGVRRDCR